jgi:hypothetical protein
MSALMPWAALLPAVECHERLYWTRAPRNKRIVGGLFSTLGEIRASIGIHFRGGQHAKWSSEAAPMIIGGIMIGLFVGVPFGFLIAAIFATGKQVDAET